MEIYGEFLPGLCELCRYTIDQEYIREVFIDTEITGYVAKINGEYAGFILFKKSVDDHNELYLSLIATKPKLGLPLGQILISIMEEVALESDMHTIIADSIEGAIEFYKKNGWEVLKKDNDDDTYLIEKQIREKRPEEITEEIEEITEEIEDINIFGDFDLRRHFDFDAYSTETLTIGECYEESSSEEIIDSSDEESSSDEEYDNYEDVGLFNKMFGYACSYFEN